MKAGTAQVRGTGLGFLVVGLSLQDLVFDGPDGSHIVLDSREQRQAYACADCHGVFIVGLRDTIQRRIDPVAGVVTEFDDSDRP